LLLGLATDHHIATRSAIFRLGVAPYGLSPVVMATAVLPKLVGHRLAMRMYVEDLSLDAHYAMVSGIVNGVSPSSDHGRAHACRSASTGVLVGNMAADVYQCYTAHFLVQETWLNVESSGNTPGELQRQVRRPRAFTREVLVQDEPNSVKDELISHRATILPDLESSSPIEDNRGILASAPLVGIITSVVASS
jgi:enoyl-CoA hydratase/carnithine racemase